MSNTGVSRTASGGAAGELGSVQRAGVMAFVAVHILCGHPIPALGTVMASSVPTSVAAETDAAVDDIEIHCADGHRAYLQVKTRLDGRALSETVPQWAALAKAQALDSSKTRLLMVGAQPIARARALDGALRRHQNPQAGSPSKAESDELNVLKDATAALTRAQRDSLFDSAGVWEADFRKSHGALETAAVTMLNAHVVIGGNGDAAWSVLRDHLRELASVRHGTDLPALAMFLRTKGITLRADAEGSSAARHEHERGVVNDYRLGVAQRGSVVALDAVGAQIPPLPLADLDMSIRAVEGPLVLPDDGRERVTGEVAWLMKRRSRVLLCGPPGGGKTVALAASAAHYAEQARWPLPLVVDLKRWVERRRQLGDREALLDVALEREPLERRAVLVAVADRALQEGRAALFLDALDETGSARRIVVQALRDMLDRMHDDVEVLVTTREVGYADAHALGFVDLALLPPERPQITVKALLGAAVARIDDQGEDLSGWLEQRSGWVENRLDHDQTLSNTPLMVVLLTLIAAHHEPSAWPTTRAGVLTMIVADAVNHWEQEARSGGRDFAIGRLTGPDALIAADSAFVIIGHHVLRGNEPPAASVVPELAAVLRDENDLAPASATAAAAAAIDFWDVAGVFVKRGGDERLAARVRSLAELAEARHALRFEEDVEAWTSWALADDAGTQALLFAASLDQRAADAICLAAVTGPEWPIWKQLVAAIGAGAEPAAEAVRALADRLTAEIGETDTARSWCAARTLVALPLSARSQIPAIAALDRLSGSQRTLARALAVRGWSRDDDEVETDLRRALTAHPDPPPQLEPNQSLFPWPVGIARSPDWEAAIEIAADRLLQPGDDALAEQLLAHELVSIISPLQSEPVHRLLRERGFGSLLDAKQQAEAAELQDKYPNAGLRGIQELLALHRAVDKRIEAALRLRAEPSEMTWRQTRRLDELADFDATLNTGSARPGSVLEKLDALASDAEPVFDAIASLKAFDTPLVVAELLERGRLVEEHDEHARFAATAGGRDRGLQVDWSALTDPAVTVAGLVEAVTRGGEWLGQVASRFLLGDLPADLRAVLAERLRLRLPTARGRGLESAAVILYFASRDNQDALDSTADARPAARRAAVRIARATRQREVILRLASDPDSLVRDLALDAAMSVDAADEAQRLAENAETPSGWECPWCLHVSGPATTSCERCSTVGRGRLEGAALHASALRIG